MYFHMFDRFTVPGVDSHMWGGELVTHCIGHAIISLMGTSCWYCSLQRPLLASALMILTPLQLHLVYIVALWKLASREDVFQFFLAWYFCLWSKVCYVFNTEVMVNNQKRQQSAVLLWWPWGSPWPIIHRKIYPSWAFDFHSMTCLLEDHCSPMQDTSATLNIVCLSCGWCCVCKGQDSFYMYAWI